MLRRVVCHARARGQSLSTTPPPADASRVTKTYRLKALRAAGTKEEVLSLFQNGFLNNPSDPAEIRAAIASLNRLGAVSSSVGLLHGISASSRKGSGEKPLRGAYHDILRALAKPQPRCGGDRNAVVTEGPVTPHAVTAHESRQPRMRKEGSSRFSAAADAAWAATEAVQLVRALSVRGSNGCTAQTFSLAFEAVAAQAAVLRRSPVSEQIRINGRHARRRRLRCGIMVASEHGEWSVLPEAEALVADLLAAPLAIESWLLRSAVNSVRKAGDASKAERAFLTLVRCPKPARSCLSFHKISLG